MARFRTPANVLLHRAQLTLILAILVPTVLLIALGIVLLAAGGGSAGTVISGVLVLAFCTTSLTGYILGSIFVSKGASVARFQNDFLSSVSHELRTPLTSISMFIDTLRDDRLTDPAEKDKCLQMLHQEVHRLEGLVERLIKLSKIESGHAKFKREPVKVSDVVDEALASFEVATLLSKASIEVELEEGLELVGDRSALSQALSNLLVNAWKYSGDDDRHIRVGARRHNKHIELSVTDNGPGIPRGEQRQIFEQFERGRAAIDSPRGGSGLGLAIVRAIVRAHRGKVELTSRVGAGSTFLMRLPEPRAA